MGEKTMEAALALAIEKAGGVIRLAEKIGVTKGAVSKWDRAPVMRVLEIERITGVPRYELRPDVYPNDEGG